MTSVSASRRIPALDGLRGVAALVVLFHHALLVLPSLALAVLEPGDPAAPGPGSWEHAFAWTPAYLLWDGPAAVALFFVLSGLVLALPVYRADRFSWRAYYPRRLVRLYVPVWALLLAVLALHQVVAPSTDERLGTWAARDGYGWVGLVHDVTLVDGASYVITPLWSLQWEVWFSLLLPLYVLAVRRVPAWVTVLGVLLLLVAGWQTATEFLKYLPMFALGVLLARHWDGVTAAAGRVRARRRPWVTWAGLTVLGLALVLAPTSIVGLGAAPEVGHRFGWTPALGAVLIVVVVACAPEAARVFTSPVLA